MGFGVSAHFLSSTVKSGRLTRPEALLSGTEKQPKHKVFGRDIPGTDIWADVPAQKLSPHRSERRKMKYFTQKSLTRRRGRP